MQQEVKHASSFQWQRMNTLTKVFCPRQVKKMFLVFASELFGTLDGRLLFLSSLFDVFSDRNVLQSWTFKLSEHLWHFCLCVTTSSSSIHRGAHHRKRSSAWCIKSKLNQPWDAVRPVQILSQHLLLSHSQKHTHTHTHTHTQHSGKTN